MSSLFKLNRRKYITSCFLLLGCGLALNTHAQQTAFKKVATDIGLSSNSANAVVRQPDGKTLMAGNVRFGQRYRSALLRFDADGKQDLAFGLDTINYLLPAFYTGININDIALQPDGKIVATGSAWYLSGTYALGDIFVLRLNPDGKPDNSFNGTGVVVTNIQTGTGLSMDEAFGVTLQPDGKILVAAASYDYAVKRFTVLRYTADGKADNGFKKVSLDFGGNTDNKAYDITLQPDGKILATGQTYPRGEQSWAPVLVRLLTDGTPDNSFGSNGSVISNIGAGEDIAKSVALQSDGKIIIAGHTTANAQKDVFAMRFTTTGMLDNTFGSAGTQIIDINGESDISNALQIQPDNKIVLSGASAKNGINRLLTLRLSANGTLDATFGTGGKVINTISGDGDVANASLLQPDGKILIAGASANGASLIFCMQRYLANGATDAGYAQNGTMLLSIGTSYDKATHMVKLPWNNNLLVSGIANDYWSLASYHLQDLRLNKAFGFEGKKSLRYSGQVESSSPAIAIDTAWQKIYLAGIDDYKGFTLIRLNKDGSIDTTFADKGVFHYSLYTYKGGLVVLPDHRIIFAGSVLNGTHSYGGLFCLKGNGKPDKSFGTNGILTELPISLDDIAVDAKNSRLVVSGRFYLSHKFTSAVAVMAVKTSGVIDSSFGENGSGYKEVPNDGGAEVYFRYRLTLDAFNRPVVAGSIQAGNFMFRYSVSRFTEKGNADTTFGNRGMTLTSVRDPLRSNLENEGITTMCGPQGCYTFTAGLKQDGWYQYGRAVVVRYGEDGELDSLPRTAAGFLDTTFFNTPYEGSSAALADGNYVYVGGYAGDEGNADFMVLRFDMGNPPAAAPHKAEQPQYALSVYPNPVQQQMVSSFTLPHNATVQFQLADLQKGITYNLQQLTLPKGSHQVRLMLPAQAGTGVYELRLITKDGSNSKKIIVTK